MPPPEDILDNGATRFPQQRPPPPPTEEDDNEDEIEAMMRAQMDQEDGMMDDDFIGWMGADEDLTLGQRRQQR